MAVLCCMAKNLNASYILWAFCHESTAEEIRCVFDDNSKIIFVKSS